MNRLSGIRKRMLTSGAAGIMALSLFAAGASDVWALPSSGRSKADNIVVRESAVDGEVDGSLTEGQRVRILGNVEGSDGYLWYHIEYELYGSSLTGWVRGDLLETSDEPYEDEEDTQDAEQSEQTEEQTEEADFTVGGTGYNIADRIPSSEIPDDFEETTVLYANGEVPALKAKNADIVLLYLENAADSDEAKLFVFDSAAQEVLPYVQFSTEDGFVVLTSVPQDQKDQVSDRYTEHACEFEDGAIPAYQLAAADELTAENMDISDFYYLYGTDQNGGQGWYVYDKGQDSLQRSLTNMHYSKQEEPVQEEPETAPADTQSEQPAQNSESSDLSALYKMLAAALAVIALLLLVLTIVFAVRYRKLRSLAEPDDHSYNRSGRERKEQKVRENRNPNGRENRSQKGSIKMHTPAGRIDMMDLDEADDEPVYRRKESQPERTLDPAAAQPVRTQSDPVQPVRTQSAPAQPIRTQSAPAQEAGDETANLEALIDEIVAAEEANAAEEFKKMEKAPVQDDSALNHMENSIHVDAVVAAAVDDTADHTGAELKERILKEADQKKDALSKSEKDIEAILKKGISDEPKKNVPDDDLEFL